MNWSYVGSLRGPIGHTGYTGDTGYTGYTGDTGYTGYTGLDGDIYKSTFSYDLTTPNENDGLILRHDNLKGLAYTSEQSVLITAAKLDNFYFTYTGGNSGSSTLYTGGSAFGDIPKYIGGTSGVSTIYSGGSTNPTVIYYGGTSTSISNTVLKGGTSGIIIVVYYGGNSTTVNSNTKLYGGMAEKFVTYKGGNSTSKPNTSLYGGASTTIRKSKQSYLFSAGSSVPRDSKIYSSGNSSQIFGQHITSGKVLSVYNGLETKLEGIISAYNKITGDIILEQLTNIRGLFGNTVDYVINLCGQRGTSILSNYNPPVQMVGRPGDVYIDKLTKEFYTKQETWQTL